jgi:hypothetical protein
MPRQMFWRHLLSDAGGFVIGGTGGVKAGNWIELKLSEPATVRAVVEVLIEGQGLGLRIAELTDALLFVELEGKGDKFHVGYWFSVYDEAQAKALEAPAKRAFQRIHESLESREPARFRHERKAQASVAIDQVARQRLQIP